MHIFQTNSILVVFYMFRKSCVHHQEGHLNKQMFIERFSCIYVKQSSRWGAWGSTVVKALCY